jgi:L-amino acid N-acyltransferase YncA
METFIRSARENDATDIIGIYNTYVVETCTTFETDPVQAAEMARRITQTLESSRPWLVAERAGRVIGYAYSAEWKSRHAYRYSVESTVYLDPAHTGKGLGLRLYASLIDAIRAFFV